MVVSEKEWLCVCGHAETDHEQVPTTGPFPHLRKPGCCKHCWKVGAVGLPGYDKKEWQNLEEGIFVLAKRAHRKECA